MLYLAKPSKRGSSRLPAGSLLIVGRLTRIKVGRRENIASLSRHLHHEIQFLASSAALEL